MLELEKKDRTQNPPPFGTRGYLRWRLHMAIAGDRPEDARLRKRVVGGGSKLTLVAALTYAVLALWGEIKPMLHQWPEQMRERDERIAVALERVGHGLETLGKANDRVVSLALDRLEGPPPAEPPKPRARRYREGEASR